MNVEAYQKPTFIEKGAKNNRNSEEVTLPLKPVPQTNTSFSQKLKDKDDKGKHMKFISMLKKLTGNISLLKAIEQMPTYATFMKDLMTKKRTLNYVDVGGLLYFNVITSIYLIQNKSDHRAFTISYTIGLSKFDWALYDLSERINLMLLVVLNQLVFRSPKLMMMQLMMADHIFNKLMG